MTRKDDNARVHLSGSIGKKRLDQKRINLPIIKDFEKFYDKLSSIIIDEYNRFSRNKSNGGKP